MASSNPNGVSVAYAYDNLNRLTGVTDNRLPAGQNTTTYTYDGASYVVTAAYPNGLQSSFTWDSRHRLTALASPAASYSYALDPVGNRTSATEASGRTLNWSYDGVNRLTNESVAQDPAGRNGSVSYTLDPVGNRLAAASTLAGVASSSATYSPDDLLSTESYDLNGNVLATGGRSFAYDSENRLVGMTGGAAGSQVAIQYDGWGNRVAETVNGATTRYLVDDLNPTGYPQVVEELVNGAVTRQYTNGLERISENLNISGRWTPSFYGYDGMGNVRQLSNLAGTITDNYEYDAFGNVILSTGSTPNNYLYRGEQYDATLGLQYLRARYYNPVTGRFLSKDPWSGTIGDPASLHKYSYTEGNPIAGRDPSGLSDLVEVNLLANLPKVAGLRYVSSRVNCVLYTAAGTLAAITYAEQTGDTALLSVNVDFSDCGAEALNRYGAAGPGHGPKHDDRNHGAPTRAECSLDALIEDGNGTSLALDLAGDVAAFLPGGGLLSGTASEANSAFAIQTGLTAASTANSIAYGSGPGIVAGIIGFQVGLTSKAADRLAVEVGRSLPLVGLAVNIGITTYDAAETWDAHTKCRGEHP